jgi:hypothetical protein
MALCFSSSKWRRRYYTGLEPGLILKACLVTSLRMPSISEGFHTKMSLLVRRKFMSALSYLGERSGLVGSTGTSLVFFMGLKEHAGLLGVGRLLDCHHLDGGELLRGDGRGSVDEIQARSSER